MALFELKDVDIRYYQDHLKDFLPEKIIYIHTHVYKKEIMGAGIVQDKRLIS